MASTPHLEEIIQRLYDSEINLTITTLWDGGFDFVRIVYGISRDRNAS